MISPNEPIDKKPLMNLWGLSILLIFILIFQLVGFFLSKIILATVFNISADQVADLMSHPDGTALSINIGRFSNLINFLCYMGIPSVLFLLINRVSINEIGHYNLKPILPKIGWSVLLGISAIPVISVLTKWTSHLPFPESVESIAKKLSNMRNVLFENMLDMNHISELLFCVVLIALIPAILEEFIFRGIILKIGLLQYKKTLTAILFQGFVFAIIHLSLYELPGIFLMGSIFGYLAFKNSNLWYNTIVHFIFNGVTVFLYYYVSQEFKRSGIHYNVDEILANFLFAIPASILMGLSIFNLTKLENE